MYNLEDRYKTCAKCNYKHLCRDYLIIVLEMDNTVTSTNKLENRVNDLMSLCRKFDDVYAKNITYKKYSCKNCGNRDTINNTTCAIIHFLDSANKYKILNDFIKSDSTLTDMHMKSVQYQFINDIKVGISMYYKYIK